MVERETSLLLAFLFRALFPAFLFFSLLSARAFLRVCNLESPH